MDAVDETDAQLGLPGFPDAPGAGSGGRFPVGAWRAFVGFAIAALATILASMLIAIAFVAGGVDHIGDNHAFLLIATLAQDLAFVGAAYAVTAEAGPVSPGTFGVRRFGPSAIGTMLIAMGVYVVLSIAYNALVGPPCDKLPDDLGIHESTLLAVLAGVFVIGIAPVAEEFFFRGFLFQALRESWGAWIAAPASGLIFGAVHFEPDKLVPLAILGTALAFVFHRTRSLWPCILLHALNNTLAFVVLLSGTNC
jgi:membrane protease YdiL (CAAX protease family)